MGYMFRLFISHPQARFCQLSHKTLCTLRDPIVLTYMETHKIKSFVSRCDVQIREFYLSVLWNNDLFETLSIKINVSTASLDFCS